jgi:hypothetical protein
VRTDSQCTGEAMNDISDQEKFLAHVMFEMRVLLSHHINTDNAPLATKQAADLAYALHNYAISAMGGKEFSTKAAIDSIKGVDLKYGDSMASRIVETLSGTRNL